MATTNNATPTFGTCTSGSVIKYLEGNCIDQLNFDCVNGNYQFAPKAFPAPSMDQLVAKKLFTSPSTCQTNTTTTAVQTSVTQGTFWGSECSGVYPTPNVKWYCGGNPGSGWNDVGSGCYHQCISSPAQIRIQSNSAQEVTVTNI